MPVSPLQKGYAWCHDNEADVIHQQRLARHTRQHKLKGGQARHPPANVPMNMDIQHFVNPLIQVMKDFEFCHDLRQHLTEAELDDAHSRRAIFILNKAKPRAMRAAIATANDLVFFCNTKSPPLALHGLRVAESNDFVAHHATATQPKAPLNG